MQVIERIVALKATMERELNLIQDFNSRYDSLRNAVQSKQWPKLQAILKDCSRVSNEVSIVEEKRALLNDELYKALKLNKDRNFFELAGLCPSDLGSELKKHYLSLRAEVYRMKCRLKSLEAYSRVRMQLVDEVINKAQVIQSGGNPYMRTGRRAMHDPESFLFDSVK